MAKIIIGHSDRILDKFVQASSFALGYPPENVGTSQPSQPWRTQNGVTSAYFLLDFGSLQSIDCVAAIATNLSAAATWRVRLSTVDTTGAAGNAHDSGIISAGINTTYRMAVRVFSSTASGRYFRIDFTDASLPYLEIGRAFAGVAFKPTTNFAFGARYEFTDHSKRFDGEGGRSWILRDAVQRGVSFTLDWVTDAERNSHGFNLAVFNGRFRDVLIVLDPASTDLGRDSIFGLLEEAPAWEMHFPGYNTSSFRVMERM